MVKRTCWVVAALLVTAVGGTTHAQELEPKHVRPQTVPEGPAGRELPTLTHGAAISWDGHLLVGEVACRAMTIRPELIGADATGLPRFTTDVFGTPVPFASGGIAPAITNSLTLMSMAQAGNHARNPFPSDANGVETSGGSFQSYDAYFCTNSTISSDSNVYRFRGLIVVSAPRTPSAQVVVARILEPMAPLRTSFPSDGAALLGGQPSLTLDGRLLIMTGQESNDGGGGSVVYSYNADPTSLTGWSRPRHLSHMYYERTTLLDGLPLSARYPICQQPLVAADGSTYADEEGVNGIYTWISFDGSEVVFFSGGAVLLGRATGWSERLVDGQMNHLRNRNPLLVTSPGMAGSFWRPFRDVVGCALPYTGARPTYVFFDTNWLNPSSSYLEVDMQDALDRDYVLVLHMNELLETSGVFDTTRTPDTSGFFNTGTLRGARLDVDYRLQTLGGSPTASAGHDGIVGSCVYFGANDSVQVGPSTSLELSNAITVELFVKRLGANAMTLASQPGSWTLRLDASGGLFLDLARSSAVTHTYGPIGAPIPIAPDDGTANGWVPVGFSYDAVSGQLKAHNRGLPALTVSLPPLPLCPATEGLVIGPAGSGPVQGTAVCMIDEVRISRVVRSDLEVARNAFTDLEAPVYATPGSLPLGLDPAAARIPATAVTTPAAVALGQQLFFDPRLSRDGTVSCATCHLPSLNLTDGLSIARGIGGALGTRNTPNIQNRALSTLQFFDGRAASLEEQVTKPIENPIELGSTIAEAALFLQATPAYVTEFQSVFGSQPISRTTIGQALAAFVRSLVVGDARVDRFEAQTLDEQVASPYLTPSEQNGRLLFHTRARCVTCHGGSNYTDELFHDTGNTTSTDPGRGAITGRTADRLTFKTPSLRALGATGPYLHDGSVATLAELVHLYNTGGVPTVTARDRELRLLELSSQEEADLVSFLEALQVPSTAAVPTLPDNPPTAGATTLGNTGFATGLAGWDMAASGVSWVASEPARVPARQGIAFLVPDGAAAPASVEQALHVGSARSVTAVVSNLLGNPGGGGAASQVEAVIRVRTAAGQWVDVTSQVVGFSDGWVSLTASLEPYVGQTITIRIEARYANGFWQGQGLGVDSVTVQ